MVQESLSNLVNLALLLVFKSENKRLADENNLSDDKTIFIRKDGTIVFDGKGISDNELKTYLKEIEEKEKLVIAADGKITSERLNKILLILTRENIERIVLLTNAND